MPPDEPFRPWVDAVADAVAAGARLAPPTPPHGRPPAPGRRKALVFAPHPDDEVIIGALPLRLQREGGFAVVDVAVTLGNDRNRRPGRLGELRDACAYLGFHLVVPGESGLEDVNLAARERNPGGWATSVAAIAAILDRERPDAVFLPHAEDWHRTHIGVHHLVLDAMRRLPALDCTVIETEFWGAMATPNLMIESSRADVAALVAALALHVGEVARNPYHLRLPAWMMDNVRRGAELIGGQGSGAPAFEFATLYRLRRWWRGRFEEVLDRGRAVASADDLAPLFSRAS